VRRQGIEGWLPRAAHRHPFAYALTTVLAATLFALLGDRKRMTSIKSRVMASHQQVVRFDNESRYDIDGKSEKILLDRINELLDKGIDTILLSDYGKGVLTKTLTQEVIASARRLNIKIMVDPKGTDYAKYYGATAITPNRKEAGEATGISIVDTESLKKAGFHLKETLGLDRVIVTLSEEGMAVFGEEMRLIPTVAREVYDVTGAGDTVIATLGYVGACGGNIDEAARVANAAAAGVVAKLGSATASWEEIFDYERSLHQSTTEHRIQQRGAISETVKRLRRDGKKIVFTNGCFDILHLGHIRYLEKAKSFGDVLIVGLNSDESVKRLKGKDRPVNSQYDRAYLLAALESVDYVTIFGEDTPYELLETIRPDILVKGGDYAGKEVVGRELAGQLRIVEFVEGRSTTGIIEKMRKVGE
jgi:D-beta-D-heptose 7-phosphate kinase/D-beta-D-heptose 1-phosphate adenosyltransferase